MANTILEKDAIIVKPLENGSRIYIYPVTRDVNVMVDDITTLDEKLAETDKSISLLGRAASSTITGLMSSADKTKLDGIAAGANKYTHPTSAGNKHIPSGGASGQILKWSADGTATWANEKDTTYSIFKGATSSAAGSSGLIPAPSSGETSKYLKSDGTWSTPPNTTYSNATTTTAGLMSGGDKSKLDGIAAGANNYTHPVTAGNKHIPAGGSSGQILKWDSNGTAVWAAEKDTTYNVFIGATASAAGSTGLVPAPAFGTQSSKYLRADGTWQTPPNTTYSVVTTSTNGLMSSADKTKLDGIAANANNYTHPTSAGNKHIPTGGANGQILKYSSSGTAVWASLQISDISTLQSILDSKVGIQVLTNEILNDLKTPGEYYAGGSNTVVNKPDGVDAFGLFVYRTASGYIAQDLVSGNTNSGARYTRQFNSTDWSDWIVLPTYSTTPVASQVPIFDGTDGKLKPSGFKIEKSVPANAVFTDTTYGAVTSSKNGLMLSTDKTKLDGIETSANNYVHPTSAGNKHIPAGGASGQILKWSVDGTAVWAAEKDTTYTVFKGATVSAAGSTGLVPAPASGDTAKYLKSDGTWGTPPNTTYANATTSVAGLMSTTDKSKLDGIATGANNYVHPTSAGNKHIPSGGASGQILRYSAAGTAVWDDETAYAVATTSTNGLMSSADKTKLDGIATGANNYTHPTTSGNKHIPTGGASGQILKWSADGTAVWAAEKDTTYSIFKGATSSAAGSSGLVPAPASGDTAKYLKSDGTWGTPPNTTYGVVTTSANGLMSSADKTKLDGVATGANNYVHPTSAGNKHIPTGGATGQILKWSAAGTAVWAAEKDTTYSVFIGATASAAGSTGLVPAPASGTQSSKYLRADGTWQTPPNTTYAVATTSANGLMSTTDKSKLDGIAANANNYTHPTSAGNKHIPTGGASGQILKWSSSGTAVWAAEKDTTYGVVTTSANGLMSSADKSKLNDLVKIIIDTTEPTLNEDLIWFEVLDEEIVS